MESLLEGLTHRSVLALKTHNGRAIVGLSPPFLSMGANWIWTAAYQPFVYFLIGYPKSLQMIQDTAALEPNTSQITKVEPRRSIENEVRVSRALSLWGKLQSTCKIKRFRSRRLTWLVWVIWIGLSGFSFHYQYIPNFYIYWS